MFGLAVRDGAVPANPVRDAVARLSVGKKKPRALSAAETSELVSLFRAAASAVRVDLPDLVDWIVATGARIGEALATRFGSTPYPTAANMASPINMAPPQCPLASPRNRQSRFLPPQRASTADQGVLSALLAGHGYRVERSTPLRPQAHFRTSSPCSTAWMTGHRTTRSGPGSSAGSSPGSSGALPMTFSPRSRAASLRRDHDDDLAAVGFTQDVGGVVRGTHLVIGQRRRRDSLLPGPLRGGHELG